MNQYLAKWRGRRIIKCHMLIIKYSRSLSFNTIKHYSLVSRKSKFLNYKDFIQRAQSRTFYFIQKKYFVTAQRNWLEFKYYKVFTVFMKLRNSSSPCSIIKPLLIFIEKNNRGFISLHRSNYYFFSHFFNSQLKELYNRFFTSSL